MLSRNKLQPVDIPPHHTRQGWRPNHHHHLNHNINSFDVTRRPSEAPEIGGCFQTTLRCFRRFADSTSLHGFKYLSEPNRPIHEKLFWLLALAVVYVLAVMTVSKQIKNYEMSPIFISIDTEPTYVHLIPFPALAICPISHPKMKIQPNPNDTFITEEVDLSNYMCKMKEHVDPASRTTISKSATIKTLETIHNYEECSKLVLGFYWQNKFYSDPCKYAQPTVNNLGFCYSFNLLPLQKIFKSSSFYHTIPEYDGGRLDNITWTIDKGYPEDYPSTRIPWRVAGSGMENGFTILVRSPEPNTTCVNEESEISAIFHPPHELPSFSHFVIPVISNKITLAQISPKVVNTSALLNFWSADQRGCYFEYERTLLHFTSYNQKNCDLECEANVTLSLCGCSPLFHPRKLTTPVCGTRKKGCVQTSLNRKGNLKDKGSVLCNCKPSCNEIEFEIHSSSYKWNWANFLGNLSKNDHFLSLSSEDFGGLHVAFRSKYTVAVTRNSLLTGLHFIGNIGGLLGLFLGFSILSFVEIVYFVFFRPCYRLYQTLENAHANTA